MPERFGPFQPWFFLGVAAVEIVMIISFGYVVIKSIIHRRQDVNIMMPLYVTQVLIITLLFLGAWKYRKLKHPATWVAAGVNLFIFFLEPLGRSETIQLFLKTMIRE